MLQNFVPNSYHLILIIAVCFHVLNTIVPNPFLVFTQNLQQKCNFLACEKLTDVNAREEQFEATLPKLFRFIIPLPNISSVYKFRIIIRAALLV